jgi:hypothetical protein
MDRIISEQLIGKERLQKMAPPRLIIFRHLSVGEGNRNLNPALPSTQRRTARPLNRNNRLPSHEGRPNTVSSFGIIPKSYGKPRISSTRKVVLQPRFEVGASHNTTNIYRRENVGSYKTYRCLLLPFHQLVTYRRLQHKYIQYSRTLAPRRSYQISSTGPKIIRWHRQ